MHVLHLGMDLFGRAVRIFVQLFCHLLLQQQIDREGERFIECYILHVVRDFLVGFFAEHGIVFFLHHVVILALSFFSEFELYLISVLDGFLRVFCFFCSTASCAVFLSL